MANTNVWLYYPNLIGYLRIILALIAFQAMPYSPWRAILCYIVSAASDAVDGYLARLYNQSSRFGAMLDMLTDRCALLALVMYCGHLYPSYMFFFQMSAVIDIASHWLHFHQSTNPLLHLYYTSQAFLFGMCFGNEAFYGLMYVNHFWPGPGIHGFHFIAVLAALMFPVAVLKAIISLVHLCTAAQSLVAKDRESVKRAE
ncbi:unnamed protein product [Gongylonema pulchrum]|uniref:CDP-diacylglycerol--inositol 3-phosphatidyltransferase n=1 Tax=Gongylonema pulchrum TaxID=637853 RepID=A0A183DNX3_9BILA|nr:unnamed protein product [Gongylonema pulchrum]